MSRTTALLASALLMTVGVADVGAKKRSAAKPACGISYLPLVPGTTWTYEYAVPPGSPDQPPPLRADPPDKFEVEVVSVEDVDGKTQIKLAERYRKVVVETVLTCGKDGLSIPPNSFFFAGEIGGGMGMALELSKNQGDYFPGKGGLKRSDSFFAELAGVANRTGGKAKHTEAKIEIERRADVFASEFVDNKLTDKATRVEITMSGRASVPDLAEPVNMPESKSQLWFTPKIGLVQTYTHLGHGWHLVEVRTADDQASE